MSVALLLSVCSIIIKFKLHFQPSTRTKCRDHCCWVIKVGCFIFSPQDRMCTTDQFKSHKMSKFILHRWFSFPSLSYLHQKKARYIALRSCMYWNNASQTRLVPVSFLVLELGTSVPRRNYQVRVSIAGPYSGDVCSSLHCQRGDMQNRKKQKESSWNDKCLLTIKNWENNQDRWPDLVKVNLTIKN